jgi:hypothetical protein
MLEGWCYLLFDGLLQSIDHSVFPNLDRKDLARIVTKNPAVECEREHA